MLAPVTNVLPLTRILRNRRTPVKGSVLVRKGQTVHANDIVAEANLYPRHLLLNVSRALGVSSNVAEENIVLRQGQQIVKGDIIAGPIGLTRRVMRSPQDGRVILTGNGQVLLDVSSSMVQIKAGIPGKVVDLIPEYGAVIETTGALVQAVWGNGKIDYGLMRSILKSPNHEVTPDQLDVTMRGAVVLAGCCKNVEVLNSTMELPLRGLILSSLTPGLVKIAQHIQVPIIVLEGFGFRPFNHRTYNLLVSSDQREVAINAEPAQRTTGTKPELVIPLPSTESIEYPTEAGIFKPGQFVRIICAPHAGKAGEIIGMKGQASFPSGLQLPAAEVHLEEGKQILIPLANLEVIA